MTTLILIATVLMLEAAGESLAGKRGVASTIWTRAGGDPARLKSVVLRRRQFSCFNAGLRAAERNATRMQKAPGGLKAWRECVRIARQMEAGTFRQTITATHYYAPALLSKPPSWAAKLENVRKIGGHVFGVLP